MSEDPPPIHPGVALTNPHPLPDERKAEPSQPQDQCPLIANLPRDPEREEEGREESEEERKGDTTRFGEVWRLRREIADLKGRVEKQKADISKLREKEEKLKGRVKRREDRISILDHDLEKKCAEISKLREEGEEERERGITRFGEVWQLQKENGDLKGQVKKQLADISKLRDEEEMLKGEVKRREDRISVLDHDLEKMRNSWQESQNVRDSWQEAEIAKLRDEEEKLKGEVKRREDRILLLDQDLEKMRNSWQESQKAHDSWQETEMSKLRDVEEMLKGEVERREDQIAKLDHDLEKTRNGWQEANKVHTRQAQGMQERLKRTEELLATRSAELCEAQEFLPTVDRLSETEVLDIVHELNENIYQIAACLTEEWMKMESSRPPDKMKLDLTSQQRRPVLVQLTCNRDLAGLTFLIQLYLCYSATTITSSWVGDKDLVLIKDLYQRLSASEGQAVSARWRSLAHSYLSAPPPNAKLLAGKLAGVLNETGSFQSAEQLTKFVRTIALERIEEMIRTAQRLEKAFMVDVTSCDMSLIFHYPATLFEDTEMTNEFGAYSVAKPGKQERIAGTAELGVQKSVCRKPGEPRHVEILLKPKVVLEKDVVGDGK